jgi:hypothetical protein
MKIYGDFYLSLQMTPANANYLTLFKLGRDPALGLGGLTSGPSSASDTTGVADSTETNLLTLRRVSDKPSLLSTQAGGMWASTASISGSTTAGVVIGKAIP